MSNNITDEVQLFYTVGGAISITEAILGTSLNIVSLIYFISRGADSPFLYVFIAATDMSLCFLCLFIGAALYTDTPFFQHYPVLCNIVFFSWNVLVRFSVFLMTVLSMTRAFSVTYPLRKINKRAVCGVITGYFMFLSCQSTFPYWFGVSYEYFDQMKMCGWNLEDPRFPLNSTSREVLRFVFVDLELSIPAIPILVSMVVTLFCLRQRSQLLSEDHNNSGCVKRDAAITVVILIMAYIFFNIYTWLISIGDWIYKIFQWDYYVAFKLSNFHIMVLYYAYYFHAAVLNSIANSVIYYCRITDLQLFVKQLFRCQSLKRPRRKGRVANGTICLSNNKNGLHTRMTAYSINAQPLEQRPLRFKINGNANGNSQGLLSHSSSAPCINPRNK